MTSGRSYNRQTAEYWLDNAIDTEEMPAEYIAAYAQVANAMASIRTAAALARIADNLEAAECNRANVIELLDVIERARLELECDNPGMAYQILARAHEPQMSE